MSFHRSRPAVLVVDDDAGVRETVRGLLESVGYLVSEAANGREAIGMLGAQRPDVVLTDITIPGGNGFELINILRVFGEAVPVVVMSGAGGMTATAADDLYAAQRFGACAIIAKPFRGSELVEAIDRAIAGAVASLAA